MNALPRHGAPEARDEHRSHEKVGVVRGHGLVPLALLAPADLPPWAWLVAGLALAFTSLGVLRRGLPWRHRMQSKIERMQEHVILCGYGELGQAVAAELTRRGLECVVLEPDPERVRCASEEGHVALVGSGCDDADLGRAGLEHSAHVVAAAGSGAENALIVLSVRGQSRDVHIVARAEGEEEIRKMRSAGADDTLSPLASGGRDAANLVSRPRLADFMALTSQASSDLSLAELRVEEGSPLAGRTLGEYGAREGQHLSFVALEREGDEVRIPPRGTDRFFPGALVIVAGDPEEIGRMARSARRSHLRAA